MDTKTLTNLKKGDLVSIFGVSDFMGSTTHKVIKATGDYTADGKPIFTDNKKGARKKYTMRSLDKKDMLVFLGDAPFKTDGEVPVSLRGDGIFTSTMMRGNACLNLVGDPVVIKDYILNKNLNTSFTCFDYVLIIDVDADKETPLFPDVPTSHAVVERVRKAVTN